MQHKNSLLLFLLSFFSHSIDVQLKERTKTKSAIRTRHSTYLIGLYRSVYLKFFRHFSIATFVYIISVRFVLLVSHILRSPLKRVLFWIIIFALNHVIAYVRQRFTGFWWIFRFFLLRHMTYIGVFLCVIAFDDGWQKIGKMLFDLFYASFQHNHYSYTPLTYRSNHLSSKNWFSCSDWKIKMNLLFHEEKSIAFPN